MPVTFSSKHGAARFFPVLKIAGDAAVRAPVALTKAVCVVGRRWGAHLPLASSKVSKLHALIVRERDGVYIRDLASRNGVLVNGEPVRETDLRPGDVVRVGPYQLKCASGFTDRDGEGAPGTRAPLAFLEPDRGGVPPIPVDARAVLVGRRDECDVVLADDDDVSPVHAVIFEIDARRFVRDLNSGHGTLLNGKLVHQEELRPGDELRVGRTRLRYTVDGAPAAEDATPDSDFDLADQVAPESPGVNLYDDEREHPIEAEDPDAPIAVEFDSMESDESEAADDEVAIDEVAIDEAAIDEAAVEEAVDEVAVEEVADEAAPAVIAIDGGPAPEVAHAGVDAGTPPAFEPIPPERAMVPVRAGSRALGIVDAAVDAAASTPGDGDDDAATAPALPPANPFLRIPLTHVIELDLAIGGLPMPDAEVVDHTPPTVASVLDDAVPKPLSPEETIVPDSGPDDVVDAAHPADDPGGSHPLFDLVRELESEVSAARHDAPRSEALDGEEISVDAPEPSTVDAARPPDDPSERGRSNPDGDAPVRKLDRIVSDLADRVADLETTWQEVKEKRHPDP